MADIDPTLFGGTPDIGEVQLQPGAAGSLIQPTPANPQPSGAGFAKTADAAEGVAVRAAGDRERGNIIESMGAAVRQWDTTRIYDRIVSPDFKPDEAFKLSDFMPNIPIKLTQDDEAYLQKARSLEEAKYKLEYIQELRQAATVAGDHGVASFMAGALDPVYFVTTPLTAGAGTMLKLGRAATAASAGAVAGAVQVAGEGPRSDYEIIANVLMNAAPAAMLYSPGKGLAKVDPDFPDTELKDAVGKPHLRQVTPAKYVQDDFGNQVKVAEAVYEDVPQALRSNTVQDPVAVAAEVERVVNTNVKSSTGESLQWNMRKTMSGFGAVGKKVADLLYDNNSDLSLNSVEAHKVAVRSDLTAIQHVYEDGMRAALAEDGFGLWQRILNPKKANAHQAKIEDELAVEMYRREQLARQGRPISYENTSPRIKAMADSLDKVHARALQELKAAGVEGAEELVAKAGWHHRKWSSSKIDDIEAKFQAAGKTAEQAHQEVVKLVGLSLRRANGWDRQMAYDIGAAIVNRAKRTGYFEDTLFNSAAGEGTMKQMRDLLKAEGVTGPRLERILDVMRQQTDDAGKAGFMKHRVDLDYSASAFVDGQHIRVFDLLDNRMTTVVDQYLDGVSSQVAFARKGMRKMSDIEDLRTQLLHDIKDPQQRKQAQELFDNTINHLQGRPTGQAVNENLRLMGAYGRMISLANSGLWQTTEYAGIMAKYGALKTIKYAMAEMPGFKSMLETAAKDKRVSGHLKDVLTRHSEQNLRIRPFTHRFEDNFEIGTNNAMHLAAQQAGQTVPYFNAMKFIHGHQARVSANLVVNRLEMAAKGDAKAAQMLQRYGIESHVMNKLKQEFTLHGDNIDNWSDGVWADVRPAFSKMMDEAVLHQRLGDMPAFAQFDQVGKFLFTYRSFVLTSHNKMLAGGLAREGLGAVSLMLAYQMPLAAMAVQAQSVLQGKGALSVQDMAGKAGGQMGALGLFSELWGIASGNKSSWGSPGLIPVDRAIGVASQAFKGDAAGTGGAMLQMVPLFGLLQPIRAASNLAKD
jgi:hypothetical protein